MLESKTYQAVLARKVEGDITFDPFDTVADYTVFLAKDGERTFRVVGYLSKHEAKGIPFWLFGRVPFRRLKRIKTSETGSFSKLR